MEHVREELDRLILKGGYGYASISRLLGRNPAYVQQFIKRGSPRKLDDEDRKTLACFFGVDEQLLGGPANPVTDGMVEIPVLDVEASAGFGAVAASETAHTRFGFDERWLRHLTSAKSASLSIVGVKGDSRPGDAVALPWSRSRGQGHQASSCPGRSRDWRGGPAGPLR